ncbi:MAG TPA: ATP-grasp domain-containing protein [Candidatus Saccharimonadales bacterium]|jgi:succinyl-CoA synthetase beta subunit
MNVLEHDGKALLRTGGAPLPTGWIVRRGQRPPSGITYPVVAKSQVPVGGRGKAGGVVRVDHAEDLPGVLDLLFALAIKGHLPDVVLLESVVTAERELYLCLRLDRDQRRIQWLASRQGGVEIEQQSGGMTTVTYGANDTATQLARYLNVAMTQLSPLIAAIEHSFFANDLLLCEVNPLMVTETGSLVMADAKCSVDDNARFRQPGLPWPEEPTGAMTPLCGTIGCIANGAGMAMSTMDTIVAAGGSPANFLDIGGGTGETQLVASLKQITALPGVTSIIVNIFAGISRCDEIARGIIAAHQQLSGLPPLFIRLEGTNRDLAVQLLTDAGITIEPNLASCVKKAMAVTI